MKTKITIAIIIVIAIVISAAAGYNIGDNLRHKRDMQERKNFAMSALAESRAMFNAAKNGDEAAYWKGVSHFQTFLSVWETLQNEEYYYASTKLQTYYDFLDLLYSHEEECRSQMDRILTLTLVLDVDMSLWLGEDYFAFQERQTNAKFKDFCEDIARNGSR